MVQLHQIGTSRTEEISRFVISCEVLMNAASFTPPGAMANNTEQINMDQTQTPPALPATQTPMPTFNQMGMPPPGVIPPPMMFGVQPPLFSAVAPPIPYNPMMGMPGPSTTANSEVGYDTNSKDPVLTRSRVFIGRLTGIPITRDDLISLCRPFGTLLALNFFKQGFAFVQFSMAGEADAAVMGLNGKKWMGAVLDVHLVEMYLAKKRVEQQESTSLKRAGEDDSGRALKVSREDSATVEDIQELNRRNRIVALSDSTTNDDLSHAEIADTMICGKCRYVTADYEAFKDHRIAGCSRNKSIDEPKHLKCASCNNRFKSAWGLLCHLTEFHRMMLYKIDEEPDQPVSSHSESGLCPVSPETPLKKTPDRSRGAVLEPTLQQPRTSLPENTVQSPSYGPVFPTSFATPRKSESWRPNPTVHYNNGSARAK
ncbi:RRM domain-containing protein [Trichostrongylus colubriformis]|uniref:RRM domain-containing protein n=1 Tax=Trichostrongylus colubriformis TaxID=6319 RepID=A0AAN8IAF0_TRICO